MKWKLGLYRGYIKDNMWGLYWGSMGIMEKKMETTILGLYTHNFDNRPCACNWKCLCEKGGWGATTLKTIHATDWFACLHGDYLSVSAMKPCRLGWYLKFMPHARITLPSVLALKCYNKPHCHAFLNVNPLESGP